MAIALTKTVQGVEYTFYIITGLRVIDGGNVFVYEYIYQSQGHYDDGFVYIIRKEHIITDPAVLDTAGLYLSDIVTYYNDLITAIETYLVASVEYYNSGQVV